MSVSTAEAPTRRVVKTSGGKPAAANTPSMASAERGTFAACFRSPTFPAMSAGAAKRKTCQKGKFHGMTARIGAERVEAHETLRGVGGGGLGGEEARGVLGVVVAPPGALLDLGLGLGDGLPHLLGHEPGIAIALGPQVSGGGAEMAGAGRESQITPGGESRPRSGEAGGDIGRRVLFDGGDELAGGRIPRFHYRDRSGINRAG